VLKGGSGDQPACFYKCAGVFEAKSLRPSPGSYPAGAKGATAATLNRLTRSRLCRGGRDSARQGANINVNGHR